LLKDRDHPGAAIDPTDDGVLICVLNLVAIVVGGGESFAAPGWGFICFLAFLGGAVPAALSWRRRKRWSGTITLVNVAGIALSIILGCAGLPKR
jgi:hypothetical protein